jgi:amidase
VTVADPFARLDATSQAQLVRSRQVSPRELVEAAIARAERLDPRLGFLVSERFERARAEAAAPTLPDGPFRGVPFLVKDLMCPQAGEPHYQGNRALRDAHHRASRDAYLFERFRAAGLVAIGRTKTPEFGFTVTTEPVAFGPARNPWNPEYSTGGSSGGSAAAVAARVVPLAHANDGGGSIRIPASECGLVGLKPSRGRTSLGPDYGESWSGMVAEGVVSLSVRDTARALDSCAGTVPGDPYGAPPPLRPYAEEVTRDPGALRIGLCAEVPSSPGAVDPVCRAAAERAARLLEALGHHVELSHPKALEEAALGDAFATVVSAHAARQVEEAGEWIGRPLRPDELEPYTAGLLEQGRRVSGAGYIAAHDAVHAWTRRVARFFEDGFDLLLTPTLPAPPPRLGTLSSDAGNPEAVIQRVQLFVAFTAPWNAAGHPAVSLPLHASDAGLPIGVQLVADRHREDLLLRVAGQLEREAPWIDRLPPQCAL